MAVNPSAFRDAESTNDSNRSAQVYKDINLNFSRHPVTGDIAKLTDISSVKASVKNLILTNYYERGFHPEIGSGVRDMLFEPMTPITAHILTRKIEDVIENFEPRARLISVTAFPNLDRNEYECTIEFYVVNTPTELVDLTVFLERLR